MKKLLITIVLLAIFGASVLAFTGCGLKEPSADATPEEMLSYWQKKYTAGEFGIYRKTDPFVEIEFSNGDTVRLELYPFVAPISVENFIKYVSDGFYEGTVCHRISETQMIQLGGFEVKEDRLTHKTPTYPTIKGEFLLNGVMNTLRHTAGVLSMARYANPYYDSASSQFFICTNTVSGWDGSYAAFGCVIDEESLTAVKRIAKITPHSETLYYENERTSTPDDVPSERVSIVRTTLVQISQATA